MNKRLMVIGLLVVCAAIALAAIASGGAGPLGGSGAASGGGSIESSWEDRQQARYEHCVNVREYIGDDWMTAADYCFAKYP